MCVCVCVCVCVWVFVPVTYRPTKGLSLNRRSTHVVMSTTVASANTTEFAFDFGPKLVFSDCAAAPLRHLQHSVVLAADATPGG